MSMYYEYKTAYRNLLVNKAEIEHWQIIVESERDKKLYDMFFDEPIKMPAQKKKMSMESMVFILFGNDVVNSLLNDGFKRIELRNSKKKG